MELNKLLRNENLDSGSQLIFTPINKDRELTVPEAVKLGGEIQFTWKFNNNNNIARFFDNKPVIFPEFEDRVEFFPNNLSLVLKKAQLRDSGTYTAVLSGNTDATHAKYDVKVQAPVSPVQLNLEPISDSPESCIFNASCSTEGSASINRIFDIDRRTFEGTRPSIFDTGRSDTGLSDRTSPLQIYQSDESIICAHSNPVSWANDSKDIREVCPLLAAAGGAAYNVGIVAGVFAGIVLISGVICLWKSLKRKNKENNINNLFPL